MSQVVEVGEPDSLRTFIDLRGFYQPSKGAHANNFRVAADVAHMERPGRFPQTGLSLIEPAKLDGGGDGLMARQMYGGIPVIQGEVAVAFEFVGAPLDREVDIVHGGPARGETLS